MKKNVDKGYEKTKPKQTQSNPIPPPTPKPILGRIMMRSNSKMGANTYGRSKANIPGATRTHNLWLRRPALYPIELRGQKHTLSITPNRQICQEHNRLYLPALCGHIGILPIRISRQYAIIKYMSRTKRVIIQC